MVKKTKTIGERLDETLTALEKPVHEIAKVFGLDKLAGSAVDIHDKAIQAIADKALKSGISQKRVDQALRVYAKTQDLQSLLSLAIPAAPSPRVIRALAGKSSPTATRRPKASKSKHCENPVCGKPFIPSSARQKYCRICLWNMPIRKSTATRRPKTKKRK